ncbi:ABC transporter permease [Candidatus Bipolaricaulota bacterium]|nr:ABC transporter permease [Candidatus Bipolaricaulota bacterium]
MTTESSLQVRASESTTLRRAFDATLKFVTKRKTTLSAVVILVALLFIAAFGPTISPYGANKLNLSDRLQGPNITHLLGTDNFGRDILSRALSGTRITLLLGLSISGFALLLGLPIGMLCGFYDRFGIVVMRVVDAMMAFPAIILALSLMAIFGKPGVLNVIIAVGIVWAPRMVRVVYSSTLSLRENTYVEAARALGMPSLRILVRHISINLLSPVIVQATFTFAFSIMEVAALNFLGVGIPPYIASWGGMMNEGRTYIIRAPWIILFPGLFLATAVLSFNLLGDALRDRLDPKLRRIM